MTRFPTQTALTIASLGALFALLPRVDPAIKGPRLGQLASLAEFDPERTPLLPLTPHRTEEIAVEPPIRFMVKPTPPLLEDSNGGMNRFYAALWRTERKEAGAVTRVIHSASDDFVGPVSVVSRGDDVWVASSGGNNPDGNGKDQGSVTELNSATGSVVRIVDTRTAQFDTPTAMVLSGPDLWIANLDFSSIVELNASTGALVRFIKAGSLDQPLSMTVCGADVWVADYFSNSVTELLRSTGKVVRVVSSSLKQPGGIACSGGHVWVTNGPKNSVTELRASNGSLVRVIK